MNTLKLVIFCLNGMHEASSLHNWQYNKMQMKAKAENQPTNKDERKLFTSASIDRGVISFVRLHKQTCSKRRKSSFLSSFDLFFPIHLKTINLINVNIPHVSFDVNINIIRLSIDRIDSKSRKFIGNFSAAIINIVCA